MNKAIPLTKLLETKWKSLKKFCQQTDRYKIRLANLCGDFMISRKEFNVIRETRFTKTRFKTVQLQHPHDDITDHQNNPEFAALVDYGQKEDIFYFDILNLYQR